MTFLPCLPPSLLLSRGTLEQRGPLSGMRFLLHQSLGLTAAPHFCPKLVWSTSRFFFYLPHPTPTSTPLTALETQGEEQCYTQETIPRLYSGLGIRGSRSHIYDAKDPNYEHPLGKASGDP